MGEWVEAGERGRGTEGQREREPLPEEMREEGEGLPSRGHKSERRGETNVSLESQDGSEQGGALLKVFL